MSPAEFAFVTWPVVALALTVSTYRQRARRARLNDAFHELRRPLQALRLASNHTPVDRDLAIRQLELACSALTDAEYAIKGGTSPGRRSPADARRLLSEACGRWQDSAETAGRRLTFRWTGCDASVLVDGIAVARALDNLVANALEHGGHEISIEGAVQGWKVRLAVHDRSSGERDEELRPRAAAVRGLGLRIAARIAADHGGRFSFDRHECGCDAVIELPAMRVDPRSGPARAPGLAPAA